MEFRRWIVVNRDLPPKLKSFSSSDIWYKYNDFYGSFSDYMTINHLKDEEISIPEYLEFIDKYFVNTSIDQKEQYKQMQKSVFPLPSNISFIRVIREIRVRFNTFRFFRVFKV